MRRSWLVLTLVAGTAHADTIDASLTTILSGRPDPRDGEVRTVVPFYELVSIGVSDIKNPIANDVRLNLSGWAVLDPGEPRDDAATGDLDLAFVEGMVLDKKLRLRAGRQLIWGGAARSTQLDGVELVARPWRGLGFQAYGGVPVTPRFGVDRGDAVGGGRISWRQALETEAGVSFIHVMDDGRISRQDAGLDGRIALGKRVTLAAAGLWSIPEGRIVEVELATSWRPLKWAEVTFDARRTAPDLFLPRGSIFSVFAEIEHDEVGGWVYLRPLPRIRFQGDYHTVVQDDGIGHNGGAKVTLVLGPGLQSWAGTELRLLTLPDNGYLRARVFGLHRPLPRLTVTLDGDVTFLEEPMNGQDWSLSTSGTAGYDLRRGWTVGVAAMAGATPFLERRFEVIAKLVWNGTTRVREKRP